MHIMHKNPTVFTIREDLLNNLRLELLRKRQSKVMSKDTNGGGAISKVPMAIISTASNKRGDRLP